MTFSNILLHWYDKNARILPWRETRDPYLIWISEIILQQTRIDQGLPYYLNFTKSFPNIQDLHQASEDQVLKLWQGLGYYSRARNMKTAAKQIVDNFNGIFPQSYQEILSLKGIGPYTAAAISSICFKLPYAVVDGNVFRVLSRHFGIRTPINSTKAKKEFEKLANELIPKTNPGNYNQAIMEFGARFCVPSSPDCENCPLNHSCEAYKSNQVNLLPIKEKKLKIKNRYLHFFFITDEHQFLIEKRGDQNIWKGLYQLPVLETSEGTQPKKMLESEELNSLLKKESFELMGQKEIKHKLTHRNLFIRFYQLKMAKLEVFDFQKIDIKNWQNYAFPQPVFQYLSELFE